MINPPELAVRAAHAINVSRARRRRAAIAQRRHRAKLVLLTPLALVGMWLIGEALMRSDPPTVASTCWLGFGIGCVLVWLMALIES